MSRPICFFPRLRVIGVVCLVVLLFIPVAAAQLPDLFTSPLLNMTCSPSTVSAGESLSVTWRGVNNSSQVGIPGNPPPPELFGTAFGPWSDGVFLKGDSTNIFLGIAQFDGFLQPGGSYARNMNFQVPEDTPSGSYRILIHIDFDDAWPAGVVAEQNESNNSAVGFISLASVAVEAQFHPADLNHDWCITLSEAIGYLAGWQQGVHPMNYAIRAAYLWQNGECYHRETGVAEPMCWVSDNP